MMIGKLESRGSKRSTTNHTTVSAQIGNSRATVTQFETALATGGAALGQQSEHPSSSAFNHDHGLNGSLLQEGAATDFNGSLDDSSNYYTSSSKQQ